MTSRWYRNICNNFDWQLATPILWNNFISQVTWLLSPKSEVQVDHTCITSAITCNDLPVCGAPWWALLQHLCCNYFFIIKCGIVHFALCVYSKFGHHPHPLGYFCAKFRFFRGLHCWANPWRKIAYSITHSSHLFDALGTKFCASEHKYSCRRTDEEMERVSAAADVRHQQCRAWNQMEYRWLLHPCLHHPARTLNTKYQLL